MRPPPPPVWSEDRNTWYQHADHFGWIGFRTIEEQLPLGQHYSLAKHFLDAERQRNSKRATADGVTTFSPPRRKWSAYPAQTRALRERLSDRAKEILKRTRFTYVAREGSD